jgi:YD repeat-containing protein
MDSNEVTVAKEERGYDRAGNLARRTISIYDQNHPIRSYHTEWKYNKRGLPIQEIEEGKKITLFEYDSRGNITKKIDPNGVALSSNRVLIKPCTTLTSIKIREKLSLQPIMFVGAYGSASTINLVNLFQKKHLMDPSKPGPMITQVDAPYMHCQTGPA